MGEKREREGDMWGAPPWREVFQGRRGRLTAGLLLMEALIAVEALVVTTIMPAVRRDLGDVQLYGWAFSAFGLATFATIPIAGRAADRYGPRRPLGVMLAVYVLGLIVAGFAPSMPVLVAGRFLQGCGAGALYSVSLGTIAKTYPERLRPRVLALLASMWILPGLFGPPAGALIASTIGWRWSFLLPLPIVATSAWLVLPALREAPPEPEHRDARLSNRWPLQLMVGAGLFLAGLTEVSISTVPLVVSGLAVGLPALTHIVPPGTLTARPGLPAAAAAAFLLSFAFFAVDGFIPLMLTEIRGLSVLLAGAVVTLATVTWSIGTWWQSGRAGRIRPGKIMTGATSLVALGTLGIMTGLIDAVPVWVAYVGWGMAGLGMGAAFPTIPLAVMSEAREGNEAGELSSTLLMDTLGFAIGAGLAGSSVALTQETGEGLKIGLAGAFLIALFAAALLIAIARRLPLGPARLAREAPS